MIGARPAGVTRLVLVRHAETDEAMRGRCYGRLDVDLSPRGREQAASLAVALKGVALDAIYASPSLRAVETARPLGQALELPVIGDVRLREIDFGSIEGLSWNEIRAREPELYQSWMTRPTDVTFPNGESFAVLRARVLDCARELESRHADQSIALVIHGGPARVMIAAALGLPPENLFRIDQSHAGVTVIDTIDGAPVVRTLNRLPFA